MQTPHYPDIALLGISPSETKSTSMQTLHTNIHSSFVCSSQKLDTAHMFFNGQLVKQIGGHSFSEFLCSNEQELWLLWTTWVTLQGIVLSAKVNPKRLHAI